MRYFPYMLAAAATLVAACGHPKPTAPVTQPRIMRSTANAPKEQAKQRQYLALPGQSAIRVGTAEADAAFDRQVEAYSGNSAVSSGQSPSSLLAAADAFAEAAATPARTPLLNTPAAPAAGLIPTPQPVATTAEAADFPTPAPEPAPTPAPVTQDFVDTAAQATVPAAALQPMQQPLPAPTAAAGSADYAVQITNGTTGRIFVEAQDAAGHIFPCGPMFGGQSINTPPDPIGPLQGPITVVVRDPDKDGAPEIRRYKVQPPADYKGKTVGITILPGGQYRADVDKEVYYTSPAPEVTQSAEATQGNEKPQSSDTPPAPQQ